MQKTTTNFKVGIFVVLGIVVLSYMTIRVEKIPVGEKAGYQLYSYLSSAAGLVKNSAVEIAGVGVGHIKNISLKNGKAKLTLVFPGQVELTRDSRVYVRSKGLLGEKYLEIILGPAGAPPLKPGDTIEEGTPPVDIDKLFAKIDSLGDEVKSAIQSISGFLGGGEDQSFSGTPIDIYAEFSNTGGLKKGAGVEIAGVWIGRVEDIFLEDYQAKVRMQIESTIEIQEDAIASVKTKGIFGMKFIEITPGGSDKTIASGGKIRDTQPPFDLEKAISKFVFGKVPE